MTAREEFLLKMYETTWANVTRAEDAIWKGMTAYTAIFAGLSLASSVVGIWGFLILIVVFGLFGMALSLNANLWFVRNIGMISNLEKEFLGEDDYDRLIPAVWKGKVPFLNDEIWTIMTGFFFVVTLAAVSSIGSRLAIHEIVITFLVFASGLVAVAMYGVWLCGRHTSFIAAAPGGYPKEATKREHRPPESV